MTNIPLIEAQEISFERGGREIASNINILLNKGEVYFVKGKNGCGKTTFLRCLLGFIPISSGKILWYGKEIFPIFNKGSPRVAWLGHLNALKSIMSVKDNLNFSNLVLVWIYLVLSMEIVRHSVCFLTPSELGDIPPRRFYLPKAAKSICYEQRGNP